MVQKIALGAIVALFAAPSFAEADANKSNPASDQTVLSDKKSDKKSEEHKIEVKEEKKEEEKK